MNINHNRLVPGAITYWGDIVGDLSDQKDLVEYISTHGGGGGTEAIWGNISGSLSDQTDLMNKFSSYATQSWVESQGYLTSVPDSFATKAWVSDQGYLSVVPSEYATESWTEEYIARWGFGSDNKVIREEDITEYGFATQSWVESQGYLTEHQDLSSYATKSWVEGQGYLSAVPSEYATEEFVTSALSGYATESWIESQGYMSEVPSEYATQSWVQTFYGTRSWVSSQITSSLEGYATESWVGEQGYLSAVPSEYATEEFVTSALSDYATQSWVQTFYGTRSWVSSQISSALSGYATESWVSTNFMRFDSITYPNLTVVNTSNTEPLVFGYVSFQTGDEIRMVTAELNYDVDWDGPIFGQHWYSLVDGSWVEWRSFRRYAMKYEIEADVNRYLDDHSYATQSWVSSQGYLTAVPSGYATQSWVQSFYGTRSWVSSQISSALSGYATESYVDSAIADAVFGSEIPVPENCVEYDQDNPLATDVGIDVLMRDLNGDTTLPLVLGYNKRDDAQTGDTIHFYTTEVDGPELVQVEYNWVSGVGWEVGETQQFYHYDPNYFYPVEGYFNNIEDSPVSDGFVNLDDWGQKFLVGTTGGNDYNFYGLKVDENGYAGRYEVEGETDPETGDTTFNERFFPYLTEETGIYVPSDSQLNGYFPQYKPVMIPNESYFGIDLPVEDDNPGWHFFNVNGDVYYFYPSENTMMYKLNPVTFELEEFVDTDGHQGEDYVLWNDDNGNVFYGNEYKVDLETGEFTPFSMGGDYSYAYGRHNIIRWEGSIIMLGESDNTAYIYNENTMEFDSDVMLENDGWWMWMQGCEFNGEYYALDDDAAKRLAWDSEGSEQWLYFEDLGLTDEVDTTEVFPYEFEYDGETIEVQPQNVHKVTGVDEDFYVLMQYGKPIFRLGYDDEYSWEKVDYIVIPNGVSLYTSGCMGPIHDTLIGYGYTGNRYIATGWNFGYNEQINWVDLDSQISDISTSVNEVTIRVPDILNDSPSDGTYVLKCDVSSGAATYYWEPETQL